MSKEELIRSAINNLDDTTAKDALAILLAGGAGGTALAGKTAENSGSVPTFSNFAQAVSWLKKKFKFQELEAFSTEADLVYVNTGDRRVLLTDNTVKPREPEQAKPAFDDEDFVNAYEPLSSSSDRRESNTSIKKENTDENDPENAFEPVQKNGRFSNLEL